MSNLDAPIALRKGTRECTKYPLYPISNFVSYHKLSPTFRAFSASITEDEIPKSIHDALVILRWKEAVLEEMKALEKNKTWDLTLLPKRKTSGRK